MVLISVTGILFILAHHSPAFLSLFFDSPPETELVALSSRQEAIGITEAIQIANRELPNSQTTFLALEGERKIIVQKKYPDDIFPSGLSSVAIDRHTGSILAVQKVLQPSLGNKIAKLVADFHYGTFGGLPIRILYVFVGVAPAVLFSTGLVMYRCRRRH
ncbi:MAG: PepSY-associated TM helix domain-containing protein [Cyanophyceae cyanobacterium]